MGRTVGIRVLGVVLGVLGSGAALPLPAGAAERTAECTYEIRFTIEPGLGTAGSSGVLDSGGETGAIDCGPAGSGTIGFLTGYGTDDPDTCTGGGEGAGTVTITLGGRRRYFPVSFTYGGLENGAITATLSGDTFRGTGVVTPIEGDCATSPITLANGKAKVTLVLR